MSDEVPLQPAPESAPPPPPAKSSGASRVLILVLALVGIAGAVYGIYYLGNRSGPPPAPPPLKVEIDRLAGYGRLAEGYADADGDLVADPPADAKAWLDPAELTFATIPGEVLTDAEKVWQPFLDLVAKKTGRPVKFLIEKGGASPTASAAAAPGAGETPGGRAYEAQLELVKTGKLHIAGFDAGQVARAVNTAGFVPLFVPASEGGEYAVEMVVIVPTTSTLASVSDLKKQTVALTGWPSVTGCRAPLVLFKEQFGLVPDRDYHYFLSGNQRQSIRGVADGQMPVAPVSSDVLRQMADEEDGVAADRYKVIFKGGKFPPMSFGVPHNLDPKLRAGIEAAFKEFAFAGTTVGEKYKHRAKFVPVTYKADWQAVREIDEKLQKLLD